MLRNNQWKQRNLLMRSFEMVNGFCWYFLGGGGSPFQMQRKYPHFSESYQTEKCFFFKYLFILDAWLQLRQQINTCV